ncbi:MAG TPA: UDP-glucose/GDP-mannose dehydrogenase family protein, partial [Anaerolineae bacterium]|nr:UDP-glucose/GDP-mannose dehydrogenase family protein [Anaerolineae bacterium]
MKVIVIGTGYVGLPHGAILAEYGHEVYAYDINETRINAYKSGDRAAIEHQVNEPGLASVIQETLNKTLFFTTDISDVVEGTDIVFMCLNTPPQRSGSTDMTYLIAATKHLAQLLAQRKDQKRVLVVNKSTVPVGTARMVEGLLREAGAKNVGVASNPEFLAQGNAVEGSRRPDRVVVGADTEQDLKMLRTVYSAYTNHVRIRYIETTPETAESIKYMANSLLLTYISFWNGVGARVAESFDNVVMEDLKLGVTADKRISTWGSYVSNGAGGSCFGKDIQSLIYQLNQAGNTTDLLQSVYNINEYQKTYLVDRAVYEAGFSFNNKTVTLLGLAFKKRTNDMRDSAAIKAVDALLAKGVRKIRAYDPLANQIAQEYWLNPEKNHLYDRIEYFDSAEEALKDSDAVYISTDWEEFRSLSTILKAT